MIIIIAIILLFVLIVFSLPTSASGGFINVGPVGVMDYLNKLTTIETEVNELNIRAKMYRTPLGQEQITPETDEHMGEWVFMEFTNTSHPIKDVNLMDITIVDNVKTQVTEVAKYHTKLDNIRGHVNITDVDTIRRVTDCEAKVEKLIDRAFDNLAICEAISNNNEFVITAPAFYAENIPYIAGAIARHEKMVITSNLEKLKGRLFVAKHVSGEIAGLATDAGKSFTAIDAKAKLEGVSNDVVMVMREAKRRKDEMETISIDADKIVDNIATEIDGAKTADDASETAVNVVQQSNTAHMGAIVEYTDAKRKLDVTNQLIIRLGTQTQTLEDTVATKTAEKGITDTALMGLTNSISTTEVYKYSGKGNRKRRARSEPLDVIAAKTNAKIANDAHAAAVADLNTHKNQIADLQGKIMQLTQNITDKDTVMRAAERALGDAKQAAEDARKAAVKVTIDALTAVERFITQINDLKGKADRRMVKTFDAVKAVDAAIIEELETIEDENIMAAMDDDEDDIPDTVKFITKVSKTNDKALGNVLHKMLMTSGDKINKQAPQPLYPSVIIGNYENPHKINLTKKLAHVSDITHIKKIIKVYMNTVNGREPSPKLLHELEIEMDKIIQNPNAQIDASNIIADYASFMKNKANRKHWWLIDIDDLRASMNIQ
jgi:hypothetical protein